MGQILSRKQLIIEKFLADKGVAKYKKTKGYQYLLSAIEKSLDNPELLTRNRKLLSLIAEENKTTTQNVVTCISFLLNNVGIKGTITRFLVMTQMEITHIEIET